jgi:hypothetical protein
MALGTLFLVSCSQATNESREAVYNPSRFQIYHVDADAEAVFQMFLQESGKYTLTTMTNFSEESSTQSSNHEAVSPPSPRCTGDLGPEISGRLTEAQMSRLEGLLTKQLIAQYRGDTVSDSSKSHCRKDLQSRLFVHIRGLEKNQTSFSGIFDLEDKLSDPTRTLTSELQALMKEGYQNGRPASREDKRKLNSGQWPSP